MTLQHVGGFCYNAKLILNPILTHTYIGAHYEYMPKYTNVINYCV